MPNPPRILNPRDTPVLGTDVHLPAIAAPRLSADALRRRFAQTAPWAPEHAGDGGVSAGALSNARAPARAAVLIPLVLHADGLTVLLTRRTDHLRDHAGQISFPGGRVEPSDRDAADTALREAEEEIGLRRQQTEVIGVMPPYTTVTNFVVTPVVALVQTPLHLSLHPGEVAEAFEVPLAWLMDPANHHRHVFSFDGGQRQFLAMPWVGADSEQAAGVPRERFIWGATAAMLRNVYRFLAS